MWNPLNLWRKDWTLLFRALRHIAYQLEIQMSAIEDLKAAVAANDLGIKHVQELLTSAATQIKDNADSIGADELEEIAAHLMEGANTLNGLTIVPPTTSGVEGATTANRAPEPPADPPTPPTDAPSAS